MILNTFTNRAIVRFNDVYRPVFGSQQKDYDFVFFLNGRIEIVRDGYWIGVGFEETDAQVMERTIRYNIDQLKISKCLSK